MEKNRIVFLDWMRAAACLMVMAIHSAEPFYLGGEPPDVTHIESSGGMAWITAVECICRPCVPLFAMASAYLLFPVTQPTGAFFRRRLARVAVPFAIWAAAYVAVLGDGSGSWGKLLFNFPDEGGHLWFVPMLFGMYLLMPLLSPWAEKASERELKGWIMLWFATTLFPFLRQAWGRLFGEPSFGAVPYLFGECPWNGFGAFHYVSGFMGYMLLGLWFRRFAKERSLAQTLLTAVPLWIAGAAVTGIPFYSVPGAYPFDAPYAAAVGMETSIEYCSPGVALSTVAAFMIFRKLDFGGAFYKKVVRPVSEASYGMYLMHMFILTPVFGKLCPHLPVPLTIAATAAATFVCSALASILLRRIPFAGKWIAG